TSSAIASAHEVDPVPGNNTATAITQITPASDLLLTMVSNPTSAIYKSNITYQINVLNLGPSTANNVNLSDNLPANTALKSVNSSQGSFSTNGGVLSCNLGNLNVGASANISIVVDTTPLPPGKVPATLTNTAVVTASQVDPSVQNNGVSVFTAVDN